MGSSSSKSEFTVFNTGHRDVKKGALCKVKAAASPDRRIDWDEKAAEYEGKIVVVVGVDRGIPKERDEQEDYAYMVTRPHVEDGTADKTVRMLGSWLVPLTAAEADTPEAKAATKLFTDLIGADFEKWYAMTPRSHVNSSVGLVGEPVIIKKSLTEGPEWLREYNLVGTRALILHDSPHNKHATAVFCLPPVASAMFFDDADIEKVEPIDSDAQWTPLILKGYDKECDRVTAKATAQAEKIQNSLDKHARSRKARSNLRAQPYTE